MANQEQSKHVDNRRDFLRGSSLLLAGAVPVAIATATAPLTTAACSEPTVRLKLGLVGCGSRGMSLIKQALDATQVDVSLVAVADLFEDRLQQACRGLKGQHRERYAVQPGCRFTGVEAYKRLLETDVEVVILATPPKYRPQQFAAAIAAGKHVFAETPVAIDAPGIREFNRANASAVERGLGVGVGLERRHAAHYQQIVDKLRDGAIGDLVFGRAYGSRPLRRLQSRSKGHTELEYQLRNWHHFDWLSGGSLVEQHMPSLDMFNWIVDDHPRTVRDVGGFAANNLCLDKGSLARTFGEQLNCLHSMGSLVHSAGDYQYPNGFHLVSIFEQTQGTRTEASEWIRGSTGTCDISRGSIFDIEGRLIWQAEGARVGSPSGCGRFVTQLAHGHKPTEGQTASDSTMTAIMGRVACATGGSLAWHDAVDSELVLA